MVGVSTPICYSLFALCAAVRNAPHAVLRNGDVKSRQRQPAEAARDSIARHVAGLESRFGRITAARVVLKGPGGHHRTGGLYEMIQDYDPTNNTGNGVLFFDDDAEAFWDAIVRVLGYFTDREHWQMLMSRAMACDFSWSRSVEKYEAVYRKALSK